MADKKTLELQIQVIADAASKTVKTLSSDFKTLATQIKGIDTASVSSTVKNLQGEITRAANSIKLFGASSGEIKTMQARIKSATLDLIDGGFKPESKEIQNLIDEYKKLDAAGADLESSTGSLAGGFGNLIDQVKALAPAVAAVSFDRQLGAAAGFALEQSDNFRAMREEFGIMLGDMEAGRGLFNELQEFNFWTPFDMEQTSQATKVLMAAKVPLSEITDYLTRFGDISQGNGQKFQSFINAFSKASAKGSADMEVLNVYLDQGIQILDELGKQFGVTSGEVIKMASNGQISFQQFDQALKSLAAEGGLYYGSMETASQRLDAAQAGLQESTNALAASFGDMLAPAALAVVSGITKLVDAINSSPFAKGALAGLITAVAIAINAQLIKAVIALAAKMWTAYAATMAQAGAMAILNPALLGAVAAAGAATLAVVAYAASQQDAADATADNALATAKLEQSLAAVKDQARDTMSYMKGLTSDEATNIALWYEKTMIPAAEKALENARAKLAATPETLYTEEYEDYYPYTGRVETIRAGAVDNSAAHEEAEKGVEEAERQLERIRANYAAALENVGIIETEEFNRKLEEGNSILERRNRLFSRTQQAQIQQVEDDLAFARSLLDMETVNPDGTVSGFDREKTLAIIADLEKRLADLQKKAESSAGAIGDEWTRKTATQVEKIEREFESSRTELANTAKSLYGDAYETQADFIRENASLESYYQQQLASATRRQILEDHQSRMNAIRQEAEYRLAKAMESSRSGDNSMLGTAAQSLVVSSYADTEVGQVAAGAAAGGFIGAFVSIANILVELFSQIENVNKLLNVFTTLFQSLIDTIEPIVNSILQPIVDIIDQLGRTLGNVIAPALNLFALAVVPLHIILAALNPILRAVADVFEWLNNSVIVPIGNAFIDVINAVIGLLNKLPFVDIDKIDRLNVIGEKADEMAEEFEKYTDLLNSKFERQKSAVEEMLQSQLDALTSQYELGLISREEYESQAEKYQSTADEKLYEINKEQKILLEQISENTYRALPEKQQQEAAKSYAQKWGEKVPVLGTLAGAAVDVVTTVVDTVVSVGKKAWNGFLNFIGLDVGTISVPQDMPAIVHQGETIIPRTFAEGIRSGELSLVGGKGSASSGQPVYISISVAGSVVTENELVDVIYNGIARGIRSGAKNPLPQGA